ncbi:rab GTPase activator [Kwoniella heveanensis BCC8398]|uniref:Rab GTPase activator n=1 Tax=Kwoniella heveanensis BCC8398 TaxID=1296120 RepID=A0A1B9GY16_9TREE|nr:rab GTPase activator [Kwoniella heveanensis BCC8398]
MTAQNPRSHSGGDGGSARHSTSSDDASLVNVHALSHEISNNGHNESPSTTNTSFEHLSHSQAPSSTSSGNNSNFSHPLSDSASNQGQKEKGKEKPGTKARLIYCKSHVSIHPTSFNKDNISGYLGIVEVDQNAPHLLAPNLEQSDVGQNGQGLGRKETLVVWVPDELLARMDESDREGYKRIEGRSTAAQLELEEPEEDGFVFVSLPPPKGEKYAFSIPITSLYSILVYPPSLSHWYGSATFNLMGGVSLPTLYFHDDESPLLASPPVPNQQPLPRAKWGFPPFLSLLESRATIVRSRLLASRANMGAELWLINPSKSDREVHEAGVEDAEPETVPPQRQPQQRPATQLPTTIPAPYPPKSSYPNTAVLNTSTPKQSLMTSLSSLTNFTRQKASQVLSHPLAQPVVPHLPPAVRSLVHVPGEWERSGRLPPKTEKGNNDVASEFESARLYLARWARVVAEEGERARRDELAAQARIRRGSGSSSSSPIDDLSSSLGVFSILPKSYSKRPIPNPTRTPQHPITARDWESFAAQGRDEAYVRREIFRRGFTDTPEPEDKQARREGWEVLLGVVPWSVGGVGGGESGKEKRRTTREDARRAKRQVYAGIKAKWRNEAERNGGRDDWKEEWHRIDVDCRRTDRNQPIYSVPPEAARKGEHEKEGGGAGTSGDIHWDGKGEEEEGGMAKLNPHIAALRTVLMTYHTYSPELGYVQGMSDLLSPIYVVFDADEAEAFWGLVGVMKIMESNFLRDQSGMKRKLSTLQQLISIMDPELYAHLERTESLNLFFCFRWILISFKREFKFETVIKLWEVLWTNHYSNQFVLFVALAVLQSHRDVLIRYLTEFDEVLKYANDLSGTIDLDTTLAQAEVLFLSFRSLVEEIDKENAQAGSSSSDPSSEGLRHRRTASEGAVKAKEDNKKKEIVSEDLRNLLLCWK